MKTQKAFFILILFLFSPLAGKAQMEKGKFFTFIHGAANFCQIDGDQASGFNKFGYSLGFEVGQGIGKNWSYETGIALSNRGSRRAPDSGVVAFNYDFNMIDIPIFFIHYHQKFSYGAGIITTYTFRAAELTGINPRFSDEIEKVNILGSLQFNYKLSSHYHGSLEYQYSINSIRKDNNSGNPFFPTGTYHNVISLGLKYLLSANE